MYICYLITASNLGINILMLLQYILDDLKALYRLSSKERKKPIIVSQDVDMLLHDL
jgi:hypothetical protein